MLAAALILTVALAVGRLFRELALVRWNDYPGEFEERWQFPFLCRDAGDRPASTSSFEHQGRLRLAQWRRQ